MRRDLTRALAVGTLGLFLLTAPLYFGGVTPGFFNFSAAIISLVTFSLFVLFHRRCYVLSSRPVQMIFCFWIATLATVSLLGIFPRTSLEDFIYYCALLFFLCLAAFSISKLKRWHILLQFISGVAALVAFWGVLNWLFGINQLWGQQLVAQMKGISGTFVNRNHFAGYLSLIFPFVFLSFYRERRLPQRILWAFICLLLMMGIIFSLSRGAWIATATSLTLMFLLSWVFSKDRIKPFKIILLFLPIIGVVIFRLGLEPILFRIENTVGIAEQFEGIGGRLAIWKSAWQIFLDHPLTGIGLGNFDWLYPQYRLPGVNGRPWFVHNDYLQILVEGGALLAVATLCLFGWAILMLIRGLRNSHRSLKKDLYLTTLTAVIAFLIMIIWDFHLHITACSFTLFAMIGAAWANSEGFRFAKPLPRIFFIPSLAVGVAALFLFTSAKLQDTATFFRENGATEKAVEVLTAARELDSANPNLPFEIGEIRAENARYGLRKYEALESGWTAYQDALRLMPRVGLYWLRAGMILETAWQMSQAPLGRKKSMEMLDRLARADRHSGGQKVSPGTVLFYYQKALAYDPNNPYFHDILAIYYTRQKNAQQAAIHLKTAFSLLPELQSHEFLRAYFTPDQYQSIAESGLKAAVGNEYYQFAVLSQLTQFAIQKREFNAAQGYIDQLQRIRFWSNQSEVLTLNGRLALAQVDLPKSARFFREYLKIQEYSEQSIRTVCDIYRSSAQYTAALQIISELPAEVQQNHPDILLIKADLFQGLQDTPAAIQALERFLQLRPDHVPVLLRIGNLYLNVKADFKAEEAFRRAIRQGAENQYPDVYFSLALSLIAQGEEAQAIKELEFAAEKNIAHLPSLLTLASLYEKRQRMDLMAEILQKAVEINPQDKALRLRVCRGWYIAGQKARARACYQDLIDDFPGDEDIKEEFARLTF